MASTSEILNYYSGLLLSQYSQQPKAVAHTQALVNLLVADNIVSLIKAGFDVDSAVGVQLDVIAKFVGAARAGQSLTGNVTLSDEDLRVLIKICIIRNTAYSSLAQLQSLIAQFFPGALRLFDYTGMRISYYLSTTIGSNTLAEVVVKMGYLPKPAGVQLGALIYSASLNNIFGYRTYGLPASQVHGFNAYAQYDTNCPWLSYTNAITL